MCAGYVDLFMDQGASFNTAITLTDINGNPLDLDNYNILSQMKVSYITANVAANLLIIPANSSTGQLYLTLDPANTSMLMPKRYVFDIISIDTSNNVNRLLEGTIYVNPGVTNIYSPNY